MATIMIVDDVYENRMLLHTTLQYKGHDIIEAADGAEALQAAAARRPELIVTDILMPTMDGYDLVRQLRENPQLADTPVIFYTAYYHNVEALNLARACGVQYVLTKPSEPQQIFDIVDQALSSRPGPQFNGSPSFNQEHLRLVTDKLSGTVDELRAANERLATLVDINLQLASERDLDVLLQNVCVGARALIGSKYAAVGVKKKDNSSKTYFKVSGMSEEVIAAIGPPDFDSQVFRQVTQDRKHLHISNFEGDPAQLGLGEHYPPIHSALIAPIVSLSRDYGWICLSDKVGGEGFSQDDERLITILASQVGRIYENGSLYYEIERKSELLEIELREKAIAEGKVRRLNRVLAVLSGINSVIIRVHGLKELFEDACRIAVKAGEFKFASISFTGTAATGLELHAWDANDIEFGKQLGKELYKDGTYGSVINGIIAERHETVLVDDIRHAGYLPLKNEMLDMGYRTVVTLPLNVAGQTVGLLSLFSDRMEVFDEDEVSLLRELAGDIAFAIDHIEKEDKLNYLAYYDPLTGLANMILFQERLNQYIIAEGQYKRRFALFCLDIERFKTLNNMYDRAVIEDLLRQIAQRLESCVSGPSELGFFGADRFAIVQLNLVSEDDAARWISLTMDTVFRPTFIVNDAEIKVTARAGIAVFPNDGNSAGALLKNAGAAVTRARSASESYLFSTQQITDRVVERLALERRLYRAMQHEEFLLYYQPKLDLVSNKVTGAEALIRWNNPETGIVSPQEFIPLLEETGMIVEVGEWALRNAAATYRDWQYRGLPLCRIAVNMSAVQLGRKNIVQTLESIIGNGSSDHGIDLEVTESLSMADSDGGIEKLTAISRLGVNIAIDDFGTGYSSLRYLSNLPVTCIKIDRSFIVAMPGDRNVMTLVATMITMAHSLRLKVVAEGVDSAEQLKCLRDMQCDEIQGYLLSRPLPLTDFEAFLTSDPRL